MPGSRRVGVLPLVLMVMASGALQAMVTAPADLVEMVAGSPLVVHGRVTGVQAYETAGRRTIESLITVQVIDALKGQPGPTTYLRVPGGQVGRYRRVMPGGPQFAAGDEVVLFLAGRAPAVPLPFGMTQGVFRVARDASGRAQVSPLAEGPVRLVRGDPGRRSIDLDTFTSTVRALAGARP